MRKHCIFFGIFCVIFFLTSLLFLLYQKPKNEKISGQLPPSEEEIINRLANINMIINFL